nr:hypothetical protein [Synechococcus sp. UW179A]
MLRVSARPTAPPPRVLILSLSVNLPLPLGIHRLQWVARAMPLRTVRSPSVMEAMHQLLRRRRSVRQQQHRRPMH